MRVAFIPWIALSAIVLSSGEVALPSDSLATLTRDICLAANSRAETTSGDTNIGPDSLRLKREVELLVSDSATPVMFAAEQPHQ